MRLARTRSHTDVRVGMRDPPWVMAAANAEFLKTVSHTDSPPLRWEKSPPASPTLPVAVPQEPLSLAEVLHQGRLRCGALPPLSPVPLELGRLPPSRNAAAVAVIKASIASLRTALHLLECDDADEESW